MPRFPSIHRPRRVAGVLALAMAALGWGLFPPVSGHAQNEELVVIAHRNVAVNALDAGELEEIFTARRRHWGDGTRIVPFNLATSHDGRAVFDRAVLHMDPDEVGRFWVNRRIRGGERPPRQIPSASLMVRVIARLDGAIGYVPARDANASVKVVARIRQGRVHGPRPD